jgi:hypothetical protein
VHGVELAERSPVGCPVAAGRGGGRELFTHLRALVGPADQGASVCGSPLAAHDAAGARVPA